MVIDDVAVDANQSDAELIGTNKNSAAIDIPEVCTAIHYRNSMLLRFSFSWKDISRT